MPNQALSAGAPKKEAFSLLDAKEMQVAHADEDLKFFLEKGSVEKLAALLKSNVSTGIPLTEPNDREARKEQYVFPF
jgi:hypothetical protein